MVMSLSTEHMIDISLIERGLRCKCPKCGQGDLYPSLFAFDLNDKCSSCGLDLSNNDSADGPAVILIFVLGFLLVPLALLAESLFAPPLWVHGAVWGVLALALTLGSLKPLKAYIMAVQFKHRPGDWE